jgi:hypothetical protein
MNRNRLDGAWKQSRLYLGTFVLLCIAAFSLWLSCGCGRAKVASSSRDTCSQFLSIRSRQMQDKCREKHLAIPPEYNAVLQAVYAYDWLAASNAFGRLKGSIAQYEGSKPDPRLNNALWQDALEIYGAFEQFVNWHPSLIQMYGHDIVAGIPSNSFFFGGTDPGRFVVTAFQEVTRQPFYVVTQNALADNSYMDYLRDSIGTVAILPTQEDSNKAFQQYIQDIQAGRMPANADIKIENGRVSVQGVGGVMAINGIIARMIFDRNKSNHSFFVEESYVIPWMYPYLQPAGLIMRLNPEPVELTTEMVAEDRQYWDAYTDRLMNHPDFGRDEWAQKTYSKLRSAIAGVYAYCGRTNDAEYAFAQARKLFPASPEAAFRLADLYVRGRRWDDAIVVIEAFQRLDPKNDSAGKFLAELRARQSSDRKGSNPH